MIRGDLVAQDITWQVHEFLPDHLGIKWLWDNMSKHRTLFSDFTYKDADTFAALVLRKDTYWLLISDADDNPVGVCYLENLGLITDADVHIMFFDRKLEDKVEICQAIARHVFATFPLRRVTVVVPAIFYWTTRLIRKVGFTYEGRKRQARLVGGRYVDELIFGLLKEELS